MARSDKKLFNLGADESESIERAEELYQFLLSSRVVDGQAKRVRLVDGVPFVKEKWGIETSLRAVAEFKEQWPTERVVHQLQGRIAATKRIIEAGGEEVRSLTPTNLKLLEHKILELLGMGAEPDDVKKFVDMFGTLTKAADIPVQTQLAVDRFQQEVCEHFLDWYQDAKAREIAESDVPKADKIAQLRQNYFRDVDALEQSGKVVIPS